MSQELHWIRINCIHEGLEDAANELEGCHIDEGNWWFYGGILESIFAPTRLTKLEIACLVTTIILLA